MHLPRPFALALLGILAWTPPLYAAEPPHPKLIVTIVVDQYSADLFTEYRPLYDPKAQGLARLASGVVFPHGYQGHAATETCPGHSTILTGARPARTGIVANEWQVAALPRMEGGRETFAVYCVEKPGEKGSDARKKVVSVDSLLVPTLGDRMKAHDPSSRVVAVGGKDRAAVLLGGRDADLTLWWTDKGFATYEGKEATIPKEISERVNAGVRSSYGQRTAPALPPQCAAKTQQIAVGPAAVGMLTPTNANSRRWRATPAMDSFTVDAALAAVKALALGQRNSVDLLAVSFSANDYVGHYFGTEGPEMCAIQVALDKSVSRLLAALDQTRVSYVVVLTADHGGLDIPERNGPRAVPAAQRIRREVFPGNMGAAVGKELGLDGTVLLGGEEFANDVFLSPAVPADKRAAVIEAAVRMYSAHPQVEKVFTKNELIAASPPTTPVDEWTLLDRAKASFNPLRSGDLVVLLKPYITTYLPPHNVDTDYIESHGSAWGYDRRVPILFWWKGITGFEQPAAVETVDIAPTLASLIGLQIPASEIDGRVLHLVR
jgi:predicted AlkP superfamily pyrophosphatase or phosphodiesterase